MFKIISLWTSSTFKNIYFYSLEQLKKKKCFIHTYTHVHTERGVWMCIYIYIYICVYIYIYNFFFFFFFINVWKHVSCPALISHQPGVITVLVAQGSTATPSATKQLLPLDRLFKRIIYLPDQLKGEITLYVHLHF